MSYYDDADSRRRSRLLTTIDNAPAKAPDWQLHRVVTAVDAVFNVRSRGVNAGGYSSIRFGVTPMTADPTTNPTAAPGGTGNPAVEVRIWSEQGKAFVPMTPPLIHAAGGVGVPYVVDVPNANGSIFGCFVTAGPGVTAISAQGFNDDV